MEIAWAMQRLRHFLIGIRFDVIADCQALVYFNSLKSKNHQIIRWPNKIAEIVYNIIHRKGDRMRHVDLFSRVSVEEFEVELRTKKVFNVTIREDEFIMCHRSDEDLLHKIKILEKTECYQTRREKGKVEGYVLHCEIFYKNVGEKELYLAQPFQRGSNRCTNPRILLLSGNAKLCLTSYSFLYRICLLRGNLENRQESYTGCLREEKFQDYQHG